MDVLMLLWHFQGLRTHMILAVVETSLHSFASKDALRTQALCCVMTIPSMCFGTHTTQQKLLMSSLQRNYLMGIKASFLQWTFVSSTSTGPDLKIYICTKDEKPPKYLFNCVSRKRWWLERLLFGILAIVWTCIVLQHSIFCTTRATFHF